MTNIRDLKDDPFKRLIDEGLKHSLVIEDDLKHMLTNDGTALDLDKAQNAMEFAAAWAFTKEPRKQNKDEKRQIELLTKSFYDFYKVDPHTLFLEHGKEKSADETTLKDPPDCDAKIIAHSADYHNVLFSLKEQHGEGGSQDKQFKDLVRLIEHAALKDQDGPLLVLFCSGDFYSKEHRKYKEYYIPKGQKKNKLQILQDLSKDKKVLIMSDSDLPASKMKFSEYYKAGA